MIYKHSMTFWHAPDKLPWSWSSLRFVACRLSRSRQANMTSHMVIILRWKQGLNCVKRWLNTYHRMAGWYISTQWPSDMHCAPDKLPWSRPAEIMATYQVHSACQKVIECLYIILPSYDMYLITFWHNSALAFILGWWPYERSCWLAEISKVGKPQISESSKIMATYQVRARRSLSAYISSCHPIICI